MVSRDSNCSSWGLPVDHEGDPLEDFSAGSLDFRGHIPVTDTVMRGLMGANPAFQSDFKHGESNPDFGNGLVRIQVHSSSESGDGEADVHSLASDASLNPEEAAAAAKAAETSQIFKAALQINSNEREAAIRAAKRVQDLQQFIISKGFSLNDVDSSIPPSSQGITSTSMLRDDYGLPLFQISIDKGVSKADIQSDSGKSEKLKDPVAKACGHLENPVVKPLVSPGSVAPKLWASIVKEY